MVNMGELFANPRILDVAMDRVPLNHAERSSSLLAAGDLLFARQSLVLSGAGKCSIFVNDDEDVCFESHVIRCRLNQELADPHFYYYFFSSSVGRTLIESIVEQGAGASGIRGSDLAELSVPWIDPTVQRRVAGFLSQIDDKIALNRRINQTLEAMAQAIFKSWFVDFDPVKAKIAAKAALTPALSQREREEMVLRAAMRAISGKTDAELDALPPEHYEQLAATAALFPDEMVDSELGEIPRGWGIGTFGNLATLSKGSVNPLLSPEILFEHYSLPAFDAGRQPVVETGSAIKSNKTRFTKGAVLQSKLNPHIPRVWFPTNVGENAVCSTEFLPWIAMTPATSEFVYCLLTCPSFETLVRGLVTGTSNSHQRVKPDQVATLPVVIPSRELFGAFAASTKQMFSLTGQNIEQAVNLSELRDTLLPKLLSGELAVSSLDACRDASA